MRVDSWSSASGSLLRRRTPDTASSPYCAPSGPTSRSTHNPQQRASHVSARQKDPRPRQRSALRRQERPRQSGGRGRPARSGGRQPVGVPTQGERAGTAYRPSDSEQTHAIISSCPEHIGGWSQDGRSLVVRDVDAFTRTVVPSAFKHSNWASFVRQLNYYGFRKVRSSTAGPEGCEFHHELFRRGRPELVAQIRRPEPSQSQSQRPETHDSEDKLRQDLDDLKAQVDCLSSTIRDLCETILRVSQGRSGQPPSEEVSSVEPCLSTAALKRQKTENEIDFEELESLFNDAEEGQAQSSLAAPFPPDCTASMAPLTSLAFHTLFLSHSASSTRCQDRITQDFSF